MLRAEDRLLDLAASVADGTPIDWATAETASEKREQRIIRRLRLVSNVVELYRSLPDVKGGPSLPDAPLPAGPRWGRLVLLDRLGEGTSSEVHRAWDPELQREVALKLLKVAAGESREGMAARGRLLDEARRLARVRHPHVVVVFGADERDDRVGLWMHLVKGATLDEIVRRNGPFGAREAALVGVDLCGALAAVHGAGLVHRDVKAQNVMRETGGRIILMDFGTGEELKDARDARLAGTPLYLAPEIFARTPASPASDLYSLGVLLFHLVTTQFPVVAPTFEGLAHAQARRDRRRLRDLRPDLEEPFVRVVERALLHDPERRYQSAGEMESALREALDAAPDETLVTGARRVRSMWAIGVTLAVAAAVVLAVPIARRTAAPTSAVAVALPATHVAVLPLADLSGGAAPAYLADALTDQLIATLGQIGGLHVTSRTSVLQFKGQSTPVREIARRLGVGTILEGSVTIAAAGPSADRDVTVNARLVAAGTDTQLWSQTFRRRLSDARALESEIAQAVAKAVGVSLSQKERARLERALPTTHSAAEAYFQGRYHLNQFGTDNFRRALAAFGRAVQLDPAYAAPHAGIARAQMGLGTGGTISQPEARAAALAAATRALELDPELPEGHSAIGDIRFLYDWNWQGADAAYARAIELSPSYGFARTQRARLLSARRRVAEAIEEARRAEALDPLAADAAQTVGMMLYYARQYGAAADQLEHALELDPNLARAHVALSRVEEARRNWTAATASAERALALVGGTDLVVEAHLARVRTLAGDQGEGRRLLGRLEAANRSGQAYLAPQYFAYLYAALGDTDQALALLERAVAERDPNILWLGVDPRVDAYRGLPRFQQMLQRLGLDE